MAIPIGSINTIGNILLEAMRSRVDFTPPGSENSLTFRSQTIAPGLARTSARSIGPTEN